MATALRARLVGLAFGLLFAANAANAGGYVEGPDLSNNRLAPTLIPLDPGTNVVRGTSGYTGSVLDRDFFTIVVPSGQQLNALFLGAATQPGGFASFVGMQAGTTLTVDPDTVANGSALLGWHLYSSADIGTNILDDMGAGPDKIGFSGALPAGSYTFWVQELAPPVAGQPFPPYPYEFDFRVGPVPEPTAWLLFALGGIGLALRTRRPR